MKQATTIVHEASEVRTVGFADAVRRLGKHRVCGHNVYYSAQQVRMVLQGKHKSSRLLRIIKRRQSALLNLRFVPESVRLMAATV